VQLLVIEPTNCTRDGLRRTLEHVVGIAPSTCTLDA
jgi:hypothetical protein